MAALQAASLPGEAGLRAAQYVLLLLSEPTTHADTVRDFAGAVRRKEQCGDLVGKTVFLCGALCNAESADVQDALADASQVFAVRDMAWGTTSHPWVGVGRVPISIHGMGVYFRNYFDVEEQMFARVQRDHEFQALSESTKPGTAHRTGIYLTDVAQDAAGSRHYRLLRCSTNLSGPTGNFKATDRAVVGALNAEAGRVFDGAAEMNHVLAQIYWNSDAGADAKSKKARIKAHSDKTKDMPRSGVMAFVTFYDGLEERLRPMADGFDWGYRGASGVIKASGLTRLTFKLKRADLERPFTPKFSITLYPNSVFFMPLSTNRLYTHEIVPPAIDVEHMPTRLGYVVRCSNTEAVHQNGTTYLKRAGGLAALQPATDEGLAALRAAYAQENATEAYPDYGDRFTFSMNDGDYAAPEYASVDEFRVYEVGPGSAGAPNPFGSLLEGVRFDGVCKGRRGAVLLQSVPERGTPIVRTTTRYAIPAQEFRPVHAALAAGVERAAGLPVPLNNALIETYTNQYASMGAHSDQALDLADGSHIAVFSCYKSPELADPPPRKLVIERKGVDGAAAPFEVPLAHNTVVVFSLATNARFKHKIVLDMKARPRENEWLGITFRTSKTFVRYPPGGGAVFKDGRPLVVLPEERCGPVKDFYSMRAQENREVGFKYPLRLPYTLSSSDAMPPLPPHHIDPAQSTDADEELLLHGGK
eukprot:TRINITY_DN10491_c0_g2_i1.p1 TRINITY_DN10491_c0_g2~~TRINITY_DN10491_c0_g2_i1.p1  ORF type:complete len:727 (+),score=203.34 TRINITY_DN10491_c0_g2_i1:80-2182(+)